MQIHLDQATHNQDFHTCIVGQFPDKFYDWKITVLFYTALHWLHALADQKGIDIGRTHVDVAHNCNPRKYGNMPLSQVAWNHYNSLWNYSYASRYEGITDIQTFETLKQIDHSYAMQNVDFLRKYVVGLGLPI